MEIDGCDDWDGGGVGSVVDSFRPMESYSRFCTGSRTHIRIHTCTRTHTRLRIESAPFPTTTLSATIAI